MYLLKTILLGALFFCLSFQVNAVSGELYKLDWKNRSEVLEYHTCGCADGCWVAELKNKKTKKIKAKLRCDCEKAYFSLAAKPEQVYAQSCEAFENDDKFKVIPTTLKRLLKR